MTKGTAHRSLQQTLIDAISQPLLRGEVADGVGVNETMLAQMFSVSHTPARLALGELAEMGLIHPTATRGYVTGPSAQGAKGRLTDFADRLVNPKTALKPNTKGLAEFNDIERQITRLSVHGTWRLSVRAMRERFRVSGGAIGDILAEMQAGGLIAHRPGGQWIVPRMDTQRLEMLFDVRSWLEPKLIEQATVNIPMPVIKSVLEAHESALARLPQVSATELDALEVMLHHELMVYAGNEPGLAALRTVKAGLVMSKHVLATNEIPIGNEDPFIEEHIAVIGALKRRRSEECKLRLQAHLLKSREKVADRLRRFREKAPMSGCDFATLID